MTCLRVFYKNILLNLQVHVDQKGLPIFVCSFEKDFMIVDHVHDENFTIAFKLFLA